MEGTIIYRAFMSKVEVRRTFSLSLSLSLSLARCFYIGVRQPYANLRSQALHASTAEQILFMARTRFIYEDHLGVNRTHLLFISDERIGYGVETRDGVVEIHKYPYGEDVDIVKVVETRGKEGGVVDDELVEYMDGCAVIMYTDTQGWREMADAEIFDKAWLLAGGKVQLLKGNALDASAFGKMFEK